jgi:SAM-dependent methyltransferase
MTMNIFQEQYSLLRQREKWSASDEQVRLLPAVPLHDPHLKEWEIRSRSAQRLFDYLKKKNRPLRILEVGCGNGWLSAKLSLLPDSKVYGLDVQMQDIAQARRVFGTYQNLDFAEGDFGALDKWPEGFDVIVFAASIQYFENLEEVLNKALGSLRKNGEVHLVDTMFYPLADIEKARKRSADYFMKLGFEQLNSFYFHHSWEGLEAFAPVVLHNPRSWKNRLFSSPTPFSWICIRPKL